MNDTVVTGMFCAFISGCIVTVVMAVWGAIEEQRFGQREEVCQETKLPTAPPVRHKYEPRPIATMLRNG